MRMKNKVLAYSLTIKRHRDGYIASFPALAGCHTWGKTYEEAVRNAEEAVRGYLEALQKNGEKIPVENPAEPVSLGVMVGLPVSV